MKNLATVLLTALCAVTVACGYSSKAAAPAQAGAMPAITALAPDNTSAGGPAFILTVNGSSFSSTATINWNGAAQNTTHMTANQLTATIPASEIAAPATVPVTVTNPATPGMGMYGGGGTLAETSTPMNFTVK
jgi:hypothetical protein